MAIQIRRGTDAEWESNKSNIVAGEPAVTLDTGRFFVGTGSGEFIELQKKGEGDALTEDVKQALLQIASKVAYIDEDGQDYYDALESALYPDATLQYITAVYTQSGTVYPTDSLESLKADLVVTAHYSDSSTSVVAAYTLSGTLTAGTSTITVAYGGKTTTFDVVVTAIIYPLPNGTHTFNDGSYVTVTNHNHVKVHMGSEPTNFIFNFSDISENQVTVNNESNRNNKSLKFTLPSGTSCRYVVKNVVANMGGKLSVGNRVAGGTGTVQSGFGLTATGTIWEYDGRGYLTGNYTATITASSNLAIGSLWLNFSATAGADVFNGAEMEFDVEIYSNNVRYV